MKLGVGDRLVIKQILPPAGDLGKMRLSAAIHKVLDFTVEEEKQYNIRIEEIGPGQQQVKWDAGALTDIPFTPEQFILVNTQFEALAKAERLTLEQLAVYEKFLDVISKV